MNFHSQSSSLQAGDAVSAVKAAAEPIIKSRLSSVLKQLGPLESSKMNGLMAYAITSLSYAALRLKCIETSEHAVSEELQRVQRYFKRIKDAQDTATGKTDGPGMRVDKSAAHRLITGSIGSASSGAARGMKRGRNSSEAGTDSEDEDKQTGPQFSASRRSQAGVLGVHEKNASKKSGASALGVAPKRSHLKWQDGLKAVASKSTKSKKASKRSRTG